MRTGILAGVALGCGFLAGLLAARAGSRAPIVSETVTIHYCSCIDEQPEFAVRLLAASGMVHEQIQKRTTEFARANGTRDADFRATFAPLGNGDHVVSLWCSNRNRKVAGLRDAYEDLVADCIRPYGRVLDEAHAQYRAGIE